jgi:hypothetical protein
VLTRQAQERGELGQAIQQTGDRRRVALAVAVSERLSAAARLIDRQLARVGGDVVEDLPARGLDLVLGVVGTLARRCLARWDCKERTYGFGT